MLNKFGKDVALDALTPDTYLVPKGEERCYHLIQEVEQYDQKTGAKISRPRLQKYGRKAFDSVVRNALIKQGYKFTILHDPKAYDAKLADRKAAAEAEAKAKAEAEAKKAAELAEAEAKAKAEAEKKAAEEKAAAEKKAFEEAVAAEVAKRLAEAKKAETEAKAEDAEPKKSTKKAEKEPSGDKAE